MYKKLLKMLLATITPIIIMSLTVFSRLKALSDCHHQCLFPAKAHKRMMCFGSLTAMKSAPS